MTSCLRRAFCGWILLAAIPAFPMESAAYLDTQSRVGFELRVSNWLRAGLATSVYLQGERVQHAEPGPGKTGGGIDTWANIGIIAPSLEFRATAYGVEMGFNPYLSFHDGGPTTAFTRRSEARFAGNWAGADFYLGRTFSIERLEFMPALYVLRYGFSMTEKFHTLGYGFLPEGRLAFRF
jgi:hypothetical protein